MRWLRRSTPMWRRRWWLYLFFDGILFDFHRFASIAARIVSQKSYRTSHTKRSPRWERLQWFSALKSKKNTGFCSKSGFDRFWPRSAISLHPTLISSDLMGIRWEHIGNLSKNLHNTTPPPPKPKENNGGRCKPLYRCPPTSLILRFSVTGHSRIHT